MLLSQKLAGFSKGDADVLRKAMGKKQIEVLNKMEAQFMTGALAKGHPKDKLTKIWNDWKAKRRSSRRTARFATLNLPVTSG